MKKKLVYTVLVLAALVYAERRLIEPRLTGARLSALVQAALVYKVLVYQEWIQRIYSNTIYSLIWYSLEIVNYHDRSGDALQSLKQTICPFPDSILGAIICQSKLMSFHVTWHICGAR